MTAQLSGLEARPDPRADARSGHRRLWITMGVVALLIAAAAIVSTILLTRAAKARAAAEVGTEYLAAARQGNAGAARRLVCSRLTDPFDRSAVTVTGGVIDDLTAADLTYAVDRTELTGTAAVVYLTATRAGHGPAAHGYLLLSQENGTWKVCP